MRGTALLTAVIVSMLLASFAGMFLSLVNARQLQSRSLTEGRLAQSLAESAVAAYVDALNRGEVEPPAEAAMWPDAATPGAEDAGTHFVIRHAGGAYYCRVRPTPAKLLISGVGAYGDVQRVVHVTTSLAAPPPLPPPGDAGAINIVGAPAENLEIEFDDDLIGTGVNGDLNPAIVVQDLDTFKGASFGEFVQAVANGDPPIDKFKGAPMSTFDVDQGSLDLPFINKPDLEVNTDTLSAFREALVNKVQNDWVPSATRSINGTVTIDSPGNTSWGSVGNPQTTVINGDVTVTNGQINGAGTLIVKGRLTIVDRGKLNWAGQVVVLGEEDGDSEIRVDARASGNVNLNIDGSLLAVGSAGHEAELEIDGGNVKMNGLTMSLSDPAAGTESEIEIDGGNTEIHGILANLGGSRAELELDAEDTSGPSGENRAELTMVGAVFLGVAEPGGRVELEAEGKMNVIFNADHYQNALDALNQLLVDTNTPLPPPVYAIETYSDGFYP